MYTLIKWMNEAQGDNTKGQTQLFHCFLLRLEDTSLKNDPICLELLKILSYGNTHFLMTGLNNFHL